MLTLSVIQKTLSLTTYEEFLTVDSTWKINRSIERIVGMRAFVSNNNYKQPYGKLHVCLPDRVIFNEEIFGDLSRRHGYPFFCINWINSGSPVRLFYRNDLSSGLFIPYEVTVTLKVQYAR